jgi:hypothetical protein
VNDARVLARVAVADPMPSFAELATADKELMLGELRRRREPTPPKRRAPARLVIAAVAFIVLGAITAPAFAVGHSYWSFLKAPWQAVLRDDRSNEVLPRPPLLPPVSDASRDRPREFAPLVCARGCLRSDSTGLAITFDHRTGRLTGIAAGFVTRLQLKVGALVVDVPLSGGSFSYGFRHAVPAARLRLVVTWADGSRHVA